ncbi:helix-turn-helix transcriptional regulator [Abiotrophia defectiva]|uniref:helix-turn-helix domain-containing protein n=1 Tax=Abiotrophia defectiva TaxID=46125 RepID=UPI0028E67621|nr:helix-turn-helix transcriptional regulator [Abiotrophia defectiva]
MKTSERLKQVIEALALQPGNFMIKACINELQGIQVDLAGQEEHLETFSTRLDTMMRKKKLDREALARLSGVSTSSIGRYLSGSTLPQHKQLERLERALGPLGGV